MLVIDPGITSDKVVNGSNAVKVHPGDPLTYTLTITNTGNTPLTITALTDLANGAPIALPEACMSLIGDVLGVTQSMRCTYTAVAGTDDVDNLAAVEARTSSMRPSPTTTGHVSTSSIPPSPS